MRQVSQCVKSVSLSSEVTAAATVVADTSLEYTAKIDCPHTDFLIGGTEEITAATLDAMRIMLKLEANSEWPEASTQHWLAGILKSQADKLKKDMEASLIRCQSLDSTAVVKQKIPVTYGVRNIKPAVDWPPGYAAKPLTQCFVRTNETGIS